MMFEQCCNNIVIMAEQHCNNNEVFLRAMNHAGLAERNLLGPWPGQVDFSLLVRHGSSLGETPHYYSPPEFTVT